MSLENWLLVLTGAACHALWNMAAKKTSGGLIFVWLFGLVSMVAAAPFALWVWITQGAHFSATMWAAALLSGAVHVLYSLVLQQGYRVSDFAVVYPVARGSGPMLTVLSAVLLLGEQPQPLAWVGIALILVGVFLCSNKGGAANTHDPTQRQRGVVWGLLTGLCIAAYTVLDGWAIKTLGMVPLLFYSVGLVWRSLLLAPLALRQPHQLREQWRQHRRSIVLVGVLSPLAYGLVLTALQTAPLSYVAPVREVSMLIGTFVGARWLKESVQRSQKAGAVLMLLGVLGLAWV
jgi:drug/metabolite transporter (DMT)-like permease